MEEPRGVKVPDAFSDAIAKMDAARPSPSDMADAVPDEFAVEVDVPARGENWKATKRIDYKGVGIRNADGTLNKVGKDMLDLYGPSRRLGADIMDRLNAGDLADRPEIEPARLAPLAPELEARIAERKGYRRASKREAWWLPQVLWGRRLFRRPDGRFVRFVAYFGELVEHEA